MSKTCELDVVGVFAGYVADLFNFYVFFSLLSLFMYMPMNIIFLYIIYYLLPFVDSVVLGLIKLLLLLLLLRLYS
jgi:hypothetical protein